VLDATGFIAGDGIVAELPFDFHLGDSTSTPERQVRLSRMAPPHVFDDVVGLDLAAPG
jgi:hypothetical protein